MMRKMTMIAAAMASMSAAASATYTIRAADREADIDFSGFVPRRGRATTTKRGKNAARRHGAKLKPNRRIISKRVRRKHRRAR